jgi:hypothetical protein
MVSGLRLARHRDIVSRAPEKMRSTATAEPLDTSEEYLRANNKNTAGMESMSRAKRDKFGN